ncbi:PIG-L deacetylase family protein [Meiothermus granaticius]|uniref:Putative N-acetyl-alpha-D-glucosaminyl L-malate deacetylase 2 n=1 Tax=Meiothermus granaticius NBRC 107808 TaxID=1227551 RepID=A0A399F8Q2_9DEIN|nr:PIG-L deacetylase family protein [Meiothermus granaticius]RIH91282.1 putative N-acetyl-alpha-D-glucosaminyl L-malate deacetylase 2 [Meiothermus granaticius NBRC 107808]GEM86239.1 PIG-L domain-containing protein [Meiothermus granaticius NBRC 107808]
MDLLVIVPHPDDEVFGAGGTLLQYAERGLETGLITLTHGEAGRTLGLCPPEHLGELRAQELRRAAEILKIGYFELMDFPNARPNGAVEGEARGVGFARSTGVADHPEIVDLLMWRLELLRPRAIITFGPNGSNRHPDHVATHRFVTRAVANSGQRIAVFYYAPPQPLPEFIEGWLPPTHMRRIPMETLLQKLRAMAQHRTQALSVLQFMDRFAPRLALESFHLAGYQGPIQDELLWYARP